MAFFIPRENEILKNIESLSAPFANKLCGKSRPGHFDGVISIVNKAISSHKSSGLCIWIERFSTATYYSALNKIKAI